MNDFEFKARLKLHAKNVKNSIEPPFEIDKKIQEMGEIKMKRNTFKKIAYSAAGAAAAFVLVFNCAPTLSRAASEVPILGAAVRVVTLGRFEVQEGGYEAKVVTPKIEGLLDKELEDKLNRDFKENAEAVIAAFEKDVKELKEEFGEEETIHMGVESDYTIRTDNDDILAIDCYIFNVAGSSYTKHSFYNIDKKSGTLITLDSLFKDGADYITPISDYIASEMKRQNDTGENQAMYWIGKDESGVEGFEKIKPDQGFYINSDGEIVICFDKYDVAPGAMGCPEFVIPGSVLADILK